MAKIIKLTKRNLNQLAQVDYEAGHKMQPKFKKSDYRKILKQRFDLGHEIFFGYKEGSEIKGYAALKPYFPGHKHCEACWIAVKKQHQRKKIGTKLMKFVEQYAKKNKFRKVFLYTNKSMKAVRKFYEKAGYKFINEFPGYYSYSKNNTAVLYGKNV